MKVIDQFIQWLHKWLPYVWAVSWMIIITGLSVGVSYWIIKWILTMMGVL